MLLPVTSGSHAVVSVFFSGLIASAWGQGKVPLGDFTTELPMQGLDQAVQECENSAACAGFTFKRSEIIDIDTLHPKQLQDANGLFIMENSTTCHLSVNFDDDEFEFDDDDEEEEYFDDEEEEGQNVYFHGFLPKLNEENYTSWVTYRSKKHFVFHRGKIIPKKSSKTHTITNISLDEAKVHCETDPECVGFSFPAHSFDLFRVSNVTFSTSILNIHDEGDDAWRTYLSNDETRAESVNHRTLFFDDDEITEPYIPCCNRDSPLPSVEDVQAMDTLERVPCSISRKEFYEKYETQRKPVMLVGCDEGWSAKTEWTLEKLGLRFANNTLWRAEVNKEGDIKQRTLSSILNAMEEKRHYYIFDHLDNPDLFPMRKDYETPEPFRNVDLYTNLAYPPDYGTMRWFCAGSPFSGTYPHEDPHGTDAWNTVLKGHKWWVLYPLALTEEEQVECNDECSVPDATELQWYASVGINAARNEYGPNGDRPQHVLQKAGETIYVPFGMVHSVMNMDETIAVTRNYASPGNLQRVWQELLEEDTDRYWKNLYNHVLSKEQRNAIRSGPFWPPEEYVKQFESSEDDDEEEESSDDAEEDENLDDKPYQTSLEKYTMVEDYSAAPVPKAVQDWVESTTAEKINSYRDEDGKPALHLVAMKNLIKVVHYLIVEGGIDVNVKDDDGITALDIATWNELDRLAAMLIRHGGKTGKDLMFNGSTEDDDDDEMEESDDDAEDDLFDSYDMDDEDQYDEDPFDESDQKHLEKYSMKEDHSATPVPKVVKEWVQRTTTEKINSYRDEDGKPALHLVVMKNFIMAVKFLLVEGGIDVNVQDDDGITALDIAVWNQLDRLAGILIRHGGKKGKDLMFNGSDFFGS